MGDTQWQGNSPLTQMCQWSLAYWHKHMKNFLYIICITVKKDNFYLFVLSCVSWCQEKWQGLLNHTCKHYQHNGCKILVQPTEQVEKEASLFTILGGCLATSLPPTGSILEVSDCLKALLNISHSKLTLAMAFCTLPQSFQLFCCILSIPPPLKQ